MSPPDPALQALAARRFRVGLGLTGLVVAAYFGFMLLVAFRPAAMGALAAPGLSWGIALGAALIVFAWLLTGVYARWANGAYDAEIARLRGLGGAP